ncbi:MAG: N-acetyl-gamma-glutamyl-phosphate reductase [Planctomycetota bacterium]|nr:MAG: N-acetyl-gamma-glutamyl-phosphate reductase [Planctomycetota bacterium]
MSVRVSIVGASGYAGGELLRLLLDHPEVEVGQVTSERHAGKYVHTVHPNLRGRTRLTFAPSAQLEPCEVLCLCLPHGAAQERIDAFAALAERIVDLSADFRLRDPARYARWYGEEHRAPAWLERFVYGLPETRREELRGARYVSGVGCNATASTLALLPLVRAGLLDPDLPVVVDLKVGSSEGGNKSSAASHHPERSGVVRTFAPTSHRHTAEIEQELGLTNVHLTVTSVEAVRGALATVHAWTREVVAEKDLWRAYRGVAKDEPFLRIVKDRTGIHRFPEPKLLAGSNYADVGFALEPEARRVVSLCAIDNLVKGAAGSAVQCLNLMLGWEETLGLGFPGLHPI